MIKNNAISIGDGSILVRTARKIVTQYLIDGKRIKLDSDFESRFSFSSGIFVTLNKKNELRGCIGYPLPDQKLSKALFDASLSAALEDPRFEPVKFDELNDITFEVTVLTQPNKIKVENPLDYPLQIKIGRDGLIIKHSFNSGLLLPQVPVEYGWNEIEFLNHACEKAGLEKNFWKRNDIIISKFEGIVFNEETPNGRIVQKKL